MKSQNNKEPQSDFSYKETLNLLKTEFSMRANSVLREPEIQNFWASNNIDFELGRNNKGNIGDQKNYLNKSYLLYSFFIKL